MRSLLLVLVLTLMFAPALFAEDLATGKAVYEKTCAMCHNAGIAGAPKLGDKAAWAEPMGDDKAELYEHAIEGFKGDKGYMPPKGGNSSLTDAEVKAAVDYIISQVK